jgi:hypothetical protein
VIFVGETKNWLPEIVEKARKLKCGPGMDASTEVSICVCLFVCLFVWLIAIMQFLL